MCNDDDSPYSTDSFLCLCLNCGFVFIPTKLIRCPSCSNGNIHNVPIKNHPQFTMEWLSSHGFDYIDIRLEVECIVK